MTVKSFPAKTLLERLQNFPLQRLATSRGQVAYREAGATSQAVTHVLLHGIGSGSASWVDQLSRVAGQTAGGLHVLAWDAPGYGSSDALPMPAPVAADYAHTLWAWLDAEVALNRPHAGAHAPIKLVGHSLGCLMAASAALQQPRRVKQLILLSPAQGYARATSVDRSRKLNDRLGSLARLGPAGLAEARAAAMLSPRAAAVQIAFVQQTMAQIKPEGYTQAAHMLSTGDLFTDATHVKCSVVVASGSADTITPAAACSAFAAGVPAPYTSFAGAGHACALEAADAVSRLIGLSGKLAS
jgi:pimeloyl-ACP methyl ester carboxylesterase